MIEVSKSGNAPLVCSGIIDTNGVIHTIVEAYCITQEMWNNWVNDGKPDTIGAISSKGIDGPGFYYLAGMRYNTGEDVWLPAVYILDEVTNPPEYLPQLEYVYSIFFRVCFEEAVEHIHEVPGVLSKYEILKKINSGEITIPECGAGHSVELHYSYMGSQFCVMISDKDSVNTDDWYEYTVGSPEIEEQLMNHAIMNK